MELLLEVLKMLGTILIGFFIAEFAAAYLGKQVKGVKPYFSFIGVEFNQKDAQRLLLSISIGVGLMIALPSIIAFTKLEVNGYLAYLVTGVSPSAVMFFVKKKFKEKTGVTENDL